ncbi:hypothetical protein [Candidatus Albibeggiatoa sp. nov. NOAA]|uniref:hypothetical protein n=1 Tax=Candidatus Albibeggiatoa sp. nov. NOAA TaxID=3162724 RepID=UPI0032F186EE|nr:hypothetical protein [Thiotrichaceae bacterium]
MMQFDLLDTRAGQDMVRIGEERGEARTKLEIIKSMLLENLPISLICKVTKLPESEVIKFKAELEQK